jgi:hypothetical protein
MFVDFRSKSNFGNSWIEQPFWYLELPNNFFGQKFQGERESFLLHKPADYSLHIKKIKKNIFLALTNSKIKIFLNFKNKWWFKLLSKICRPNFSKTNLDASESAKNTIVLTSPKLKMLMKNVLLYRRRTKSSFKHFRFGRSKSPVKGWRY